MASDYAKPMEDTTMFDRKRPVYHMLSGLLRAIDNVGPKDPWAAKHRETIQSILANDMPSGSGFDRGTTLDDSSTPERLVFNTSYHHMDANGIYDGWTDHQVIVTPSLQFRISLRVTGRNRNDIKEHIAETFVSTLNAEIER
jgi:hypothetical protein